MLKVFTFISRFQWALLILAAPFLLFPNPRRSLALLVVPLLWIITWLATRKPIPNTPLNLPILCMLVMVLVSLYATFDIAFSLPKIAGMVLGVGLYYLIVQTALTAKGLRFVLAVFLASGLGVAGLGLLGTTWMAKFAFLQPVLSRLPFLIKGLPGADSGFHPNEVAGALLWVLPAFLVIAGLALTHLREFSSRLGWSLTLIGTLLFLLLTLFTAGVFLLTQSRGGLIGLIITLVLLPVMLLPSAGRWSMRAMYLACLVILIAGLGLAAWRMGWVEKLNAISSTGDNPAFSLNTLSGRVEVWSRAIYGIQDFPFTGMGMNTFRKVVQVLYPLFTVSPDVDIGHAHNEFLQAALDLGIPGLIAFLALYLGAFWMLAQTWKWTTTGGSLELQQGKGLEAILSAPGAVKALVLGLGGGLLAHAIYGLTDAVALGAKPGILFWMLLGLVTGLYLRQQRLLRQAGAIP